MKVRLANKFDLTYFIGLVRKVHHDEEIGLFKVELEDDYLNRLFVSIINGAGIVIIVEDDNKPIGMLAGVIAPSIWSSKVLIMNEILWYVEEEYRNARAGYLLLKQYKESCDEMIKNKRITYHTITTVKSMFDTNLTRFGYNKVGETWINEEG